jgi:hypothetical protein
MKAILSGRKPHRSVGPSRLGWLMVALSYAMVAWIILAY